MITEQRNDVYSPPVLQPSAATILGTTVPFNDFDTTYHWEELQVLVTIVANATAPSSLTLDGVLNLVSNIKLDVNYKPWGGAFTVVNCSGIGMLEYAANAGLNLDAATLNLIAEHTKGTPALTASNTYRLCYRVPFVPPMVTEGLRSRMLLPVPLMDAPPKLTLTFSSAAAMYGAGTLDTVLVQLYPIRREVPQALHDKFMADGGDFGGYFKMDLIENLFNIPIGVTTEQHVPIIQPGHLGTLAVRLYKGGASVTRADPSLSTTAGSETVWSLMTKAKTYQQFHWKSLWTQNNWSRVLNSANQTYSPSIASKPAANTNFPEPCSVMFDFLGGNGLNDANEMGGCLDCNLPANPGQRMELVGNVASTATNAGSIYTISHRFHDQKLVAKFQKA